MVVSSTVAVVLWLTRGRQASATANAGQDVRLQAMGREIGELKKRLDDMADSHALIARLEERIGAQARQLEQLPATIGSAVGQGIREALSAVLNGARRTA
jgi:hypothetical protein